MNSGRRGDKVPPGLPEDVHLDLLPTFHCSQWQSVMRATARLW